MTGFPAPDKFFIGKATNYPDIVELNFGGTWTDSETVTITIDGDDLVVTLDGQTTGATVADAVKAALSGEAPAIDETVSASISSFPMFGTATVDQPATDRVRIIGAPGVPIVITSAKSSASGTLTQDTVQTATGQWHADNVDNYGGGVLPTVGDVISLETVGQAMRYGLAALDDCAGLIIRTGELGTPTSSVSMNVTCAVEVGMGGADALPAPTLVRINGNSNIVNLTVFNTSTTGNQPAVKVTGAAATSTAVVYGGTVEMSSTGSTSLSVFGGKVDYTDSTDVDTVLTKGGETMLFGAVSTECRIDGGTLWHYSGALTSPLDLFSGTYVMMHNDGAAAVRIYDGTLDLSQVGEDLTVFSAPLEVFGSGGINDRNGRLAATTIIDINGVDDLNEIHLDPRIRLTLSANTGGVA